MTKCASVNLPEPPLRLHQQPRMRILGRPLESPQDNTNVRILRPTIMVSGIPLFLCLGKESRILSDYVAVVTPSFALHCRRSPARRADSSTTRVAVQRPSLGPRLWGLQFGLAWKVRMQCYMRKRIPAKQILIKYEQKYIYRYTRGYMHIYNI